MLPHFRNRTEAGQRLARRLGGYANRDDVLVLALPGGSVPIAFEIARALNVPLDIVLVQKLGVPGCEKLAMGAIASGGVRTLKEDIVEAFRIPQHVIDAVTTHEQQALAQRERAYRGERPAPNFREQTIILVDDGLTPSASLHAAIAAVRQQQPARIVAAIATIAPETLAALRSKVDEIVYIIAPRPFYAVGVWYEDFTPPSDAEVCALLERAAASLSPAS